MTHDKSTDTAEEMEHKAITLREKIRQILIKSLVMNYDISFIIWLF